MADEYAKLHLPLCLHRNSQNPPPTREAYCSPMVTVVVGGNHGFEAKTFSVYKDILTFHSTYFRNALKDEWVEGEVKPINLTDDDPDAFQIFHYWLFSKRLYHPGPASPSSGVQAIPLSYTKIAEVFVFGDKRDIPELRNAALDLLFAKIVAEWQFPYNDLKYVWDNTLKGSPLRQLILYDCLMWFTLDGLEKQAAWYPKEFLIDLILTAKKEKQVLGVITNDKQQDRWIADMKTVFCNKYHTHQKPAMAPFPPVT